MCRALLYLGSRVLLDDLLFKPDNSLVKQVYMPKMLNMLNLAGFGMKAWDQDSFSPELPFSTPLSVSPSRSLPELFSMSVAEI